MLEKGGFVDTEGREYVFGDYTPGRYAWILEDVKQLPEPIPAKGHQGLWNWEPHWMSFYYIYLHFYDEYGRVPTWEDAMAHCGVEVQADWLDRLRRSGAIIDSGRYRNGWTVVKVIYRDKAG